MLRYTAQLFGVTVFALGLIWFAGTGEALQVTKAAEPVLWADTFQIDTDTEAPATEISPEKKKDNFLQSVKRLQQAAYFIKNKYMEELEPSEMVKAGIRGMLSDLDRFSVLMEPISYDALMESTRGKYEGLGMQIDARDDHIVIVSPIEGTPAYRRGLRAGDVIWEIDAKPTEGMKSSDAAKLMRGKAGTSVVLSIRRSGIADMMEFEVERAVITLKSVNYYGVVPGTDIGYVRLSRFAQRTSRELREAINDLNGQNISSLIFDLRNNGGGLLDQAKETAELFLQEGRQIVYSKGQTESSIVPYHSEKPPLFPDKPLIVLVDEGTASASEIVSGAIQDWDRGLILGQTTYGKGLVQQIFKLSADNSLPLKLTTAKYYVPSGRCIQKEDKQGKKGANHPAVATSDEEGDEADSLSDTLTISDKEIFYTNGGRVVYGGGGIVPDIESDRETWKPIEINLERKAIFFDYAVKYVTDNPNVKPDMTVTPEILDDFGKFMVEKEFDYKTSLQVSLEKLSETVESEEKTDIYQAALDNLAAQIEREKEHDFDTSIDYIKKAIKRAIVASIAGERGVYEQIVLRQDKTVQQAVELLQAAGEYSKLISEGQKKVELN